MHRPNSRVGLIDPLEPRTLLAAYYLSPSGNDGAAGTISAPWRTLAHAAGSVANGDEVILRAGTYAGGVSFDTPNLTLRSHTGERAVIAAPINNSSVLQALGLDVHSSGTTIRDLEISGGYYYSIKLETQWGFGSLSASNITIANNILHDSGRDVIKITPGCHHVSILNNEIYNSGMRDPSNAEGVDNVNGDDMLMAGNYVHDIATVGVYPKGGAARAIVERNRFENMGWLGIALGFYTDAEFFDADNPQYYESIDNIARNNIIVNTGMAGIGLYAALRPQVYNNTLVNVATSAQAGILLSPGDVAAPSGHFTPPNRDVSIYNNIVSSPAAGIFQIRQVGGPGLAGSINIDNNRYYRSGGAASFRDDRTGFVGSLAQWRTHIGGEGASGEGNPLLDVNEHLTSTSLAIDTGRTLSGFSDDFDGNTRSGAWDVGADEMGNITPTLPAAPSNLSATAISPLQVSLSWSDNSSNEIGFKVQRRLVGGIWLSLPNTAGNATSYVDTTAVPLTSYEYRIAATNALGDSSFSNIAAVTTPAAGTTIFSPIAHFGDFANYTPLTSSRWQVSADGGDQRLFLNTSSHSGSAEDLLGEYAIINNRTYGDFDLTLNTRSNESLAANPSADFVLVFGYQNPATYNYLMFSSQAGNTRLFRVVNNTVTAYAPAASAGILDANWHQIRLQRTGNTLTAWRDGNQLLSITNANLAAAGAVGVGSYNDSAYFDNIDIRTVSSIRGDANRDGVVTISDFLVVAANMNQAGDWESGDFNGDGIVTISDFLDVAANFNNSASIAGSVALADSILA